MVGFFVIQHNIRNLSFFICNFHKQFIHNHQILISTKKEDITHINQLLLVFGAELKEPPTCLYVFLLKGQNKVC